MGSSSTYGAYPVVVQMDKRLQILGARIERQFGREPAENGPSAFRAPELIVIIRPRFPRTDA
jgi:hypothetical protein